MAFQGDSIFWVEVEKIVPNPYQPRREFDQEKLGELSESIRMYGVLQPLTVSRQERSREDGTFYTEYELIAGERRLRASRLAGLAQVPVIIREGEDSEQEKLELAIIENLQREDLNAVDRALAFRQLADNFGLSHSQVAKKVGRSREYVSNSIRILNLPDYILLSLKQGDLGEGHARTLLMLSDKPEELDTVYREILLKKLSVREVERIARKIATDKVRKKNASDIDPDLIEIEKQFTETLGTRVQILKTDYGGRLTIDYFSQEDLEQMLVKLRDDAALAAAESADGAADFEQLTEHTPLASVDEPAVTESPVTESAAESVVASESPHQDPPAAMEPVPASGAAHAPDSPNGTTEPRAQFDAPSQPMTATADYDQARAPSAKEAVSEQPPELSQPEVVTTVVERETVSWAVSPEPATAPTPTPEPTADARTESEVASEVSSAAPAPTPEAEAPSPAPTPAERPAPRTEDDSNLYAIRNFGI